MKIFAIITGILTAILGCFAISLPLRVFLGIGWILGALVLVNGITGAITAFSKKKHGFLQQVRPLSLSMKTG